MWQTYHEQGRSPDHGGGLMSPSSLRTTVSVVVPVLDEERHIVACLRSIAQQSYDDIVEILVVDGGSSDRTRELSADADARVRVLANPRRIQAAALNVALAAARGDVIVRVDGHCTLEPDYVARCVDALATTPAAIVGGAMQPRGSSARERGIAAAMRSRVGAGPARFHGGHRSGWTDTVYLGAYRTVLARATGGYREDVGVNEDAEFAYRMRSRGGVWYDTAIRSTYIPRTGLRSLARQFYRYGRSRALTVRAHPASLSARQLAAPLLVVALLSPWRRSAAVVYACVVAAGTAQATLEDGAAAPSFATALPVMHVSWGAGFLLGLVRGRPPASIAPSARPGPQERAA